MNLNNPRIVIAIRGQSNSNKSLDNLRKPEDSEKVLTKHPSVGRHKQHANEKSVVHAHRTPVEAEGEHRKSISYYKIFRYSISNKL